MVSSLTWIAHDRDEHDRVNRILASLKQSEARDELGLGAVRDSLADQLFPGTSTIQTRIRYFLIVPWCHQHIESRGVGHPRFAREVEKLERDLIAPLLDHEDVAGVFGRVTGRAVKRLPSSVYWAGLAAWKIRKQDLSQSAYARQIDQFYARRKAVDSKDDGEATRDPYATMWDPDLPKPPADFPERLDLNLTHLEAEFLRDRIHAAHRHSMLSRLAIAPTLAPLDEIDFPWDYPTVNQFSPGLREILNHAQMLSEIMWGAALLYNWMLSRLPAPEETRDRLDEIEAARAADLTQWREGILIGTGGLERLASWDLVRLREFCRHPGHKVTDRTWKFLRTWRERVLLTKGQVEQDQTACELIRQRELDMKRKRGRSRFKNDSLRAIWNGSAGTGRMRFRWNTVCQELLDLHDGLART